MLFRMVLIGTTLDYKKNLDIAKELNHTASISSLGVICPDDVIELKVNNIDEGKDFMKKFFKKTGKWAKRYEYVEGESFWSKDYKTYIGTRVWNDSPCYHVTETKENFHTFMD